MYCKFYTSPKLLINYEHHILYCIDNLWYLDINGTSKHIIPKRRIFKSCEFHTHIFFFLLRFEVLKKNIKTYRINLKDMIWNLANTLWYWHQRRVSLGSFVCQTRYRWSDFNLSSNKEAKNCWTWIQTIATVASELPCALRGPGRLFSWQICSSCIISIWTFDK